LTSDMKSALGLVYGNDRLLLKTQEARYQRDMLAFAAKYGPGPVTFFHAPGRINLIGEHTDYNHGYVMPMALDKDVLILARPRQDQIVNLANVELSFSSRQFRISQDIAPQPIGDWANYAQGPAQLLEREFGPGLRGYDALIDGAAPHGVPRGAGLSSSSALTVAHAVTLVCLNGLKLEGPALAETCGRAEWYVGTRGGIMDQFISVLARRDHALFLDCRPTPGAPGGYVMHHVPIPAGYAVVVADSSIRHRNTGPLYNRRVAEGRIGVRLLQQHYPGITHLRDVENNPWPDIEGLLPEVIHTDELRAQGIDPGSILDHGVSAQTDTFYVRRRCRHVITENRRVLESITALEKGDVAAFGRLMNEAHTSARDDYEISTPEIEVLVRLANELPETRGARLTGAGWGGCIVALVEQEGIEAFRRHLTQGYKRETGLDTQVTVCHSAAGAGQVFETRTL
jgi:galactokinase